jgi:biopolymer transport protein ExbD
MAIKRNRRFHAEVATSALSDIMFFLLLFFLIISTLANPNVIKVPLPKSDANEKTNKAHVTVSVDLDGKYYVDKREVAFSELEQILLESTAKLNDNTVILRIPGESKVQLMVDLLKIGMVHDLKMLISTAPASK